MYEIIEPSVIFFNCTTSQKINSFPTHNFSLIRLKFLEIHDISLVNKFILTFLLIASYFMRNFVFLSFHSVVIYLNNISVCQFLSKNYVNMQVYLHINVLHSLYLGSFLNAEDCVIQNASDRAIIFMAKCKVLDPAKIVQIAHIQNSAEFLQLSCCIPKLSSLHHHNTRVSLTRVEHKILSLFFYSFHTDDTTHVNYTAIELR